jgi:lysozyme
MTICSVIEYCMDGRVLLHTMARPGAEQIILPRKLKLPLTLKYFAGTVFLSLAMTSVGMAQDKEASWQPLTEEPSRGQLFKDYAAATTKPLNTNNRFSRLRSYSFVFPYAFKFPRDATHDRDGSVRRDILFGLDISHYQGKNFPVSALKEQQVSFIYVKATQGTGLKDSEFGSTWAALAALPDASRIPRGAYHFLASAFDQSGQDQASRFLAYVNLHGGFRPGDLPPAMDLEWDRICRTCDDRWTTNHRTAEEIIKTARDYLDKIKQDTGRTPLLYTNKTFLADHGITSETQIAALTHGVKVWIFDLSESDRRLEVPNPRQNLPHALWQFSWAGALPAGYLADVDVNVFKGSPAAFAAIFLGRD